MRDGNDGTLVVQARTNVQHRPRVYRTIAKKCTDDFKFESLFDQHDTVNGREVELHLGIER